MTTRYVDGTDGNDAWNGLAAVWDGTNGPKKTWNGAEDTPVTAGDLVHVRSGVYRETLTCDVSGSAGNPIEYRGDYAGVIWSGGGVVRITGSNDDISATRGSCITATSKNYRNFINFCFDGTYAVCVSAASPVGWRIDKCYFSNSFAGCCTISSAAQLAVEISNSFFGFSRAGVYLLSFTHTSAVGDTGHVVTNCIFQASGIAGGIYSEKIGGLTVRNSTMIGAQYCVLALNVGAGQTVVVENCIIANSTTGLHAGAVGMITENYNAIVGCQTPRTNVSTGANSNAYPPLFDARWFFELVAGGNMLSPFDLASYSPLINVAGTSPTTTDMRGTSVQGAQREWGALEYDSTLLIEEGAGGGGGGGPVIGSRIVRGLGAI